jgi:DNA-binding NarL/FixJ family response regulator
MTQNRKITVMLADDHNVGRQMFSSFIKQNQENMRVIGEAANGQELLDLVAGNEPDIVILDLEMPVLDGYKTLKILSEKHPNVKTIIFSSHYNEFYISELILCGARGYVSKTAFATEVFRTINEVYTEGFYFNKGISSHIMQTLIEDRKLQHLISSKQLSPREIEVLQQICDEKQNKEIAAVLNITERTVEYHKKQLYTKTNTVSVVGLVKYAIRSGITTSVI